MATNSQKPSDNPNPKLDLNPTVPPPKSDDASSASVSGADDSKSSSVTVVSDVEKKMRRAERFGISVQLTEVEKRNSRAERFGTNTGSVTSPSSVSGSGSDSSKKSEELKRKARADRFGIRGPPVASEEDAKKKARLARFSPAAKTDPLEDDKRKARALRFASSNSVSESNGKVKPVTTEAIAGKAEGVA